MIAGGHAGRVEDFCQFLGFGSQFNQSFRRQQIGALNQFNSKCHFIVES
jgi:hypothetical protein